MISAWTVFAKLIWWALTVLNPDPEQPSRWPSLRLVLEILRASKRQMWGAKSGYEETLIGVLDAIVQATDVLECFGGLDLHRDIITPKKHLLLEMPNVAPAWVRQFITDLLLAQLLYGCIHRHEKVFRTVAMVILDEADQDATAISDRQFPDGMSPLSQLLRMGREYGLMAVVGLSRLNHASPYVLTEPLYTLVFTQSDAASIQAARNTLCLPPSPQTDAMFPSLEPGFCIAREAQGPWPRPMLVKIAPMPPGRSTTPPSYDSHPIIPSQRLDELEEIMNAVAGMRVPKKVPKAKPSLSTHARSLVELMTMHPYVPTTRLWRLANVHSTATQAVVRKELLEHDLVTLEKVGIGKRQLWLGVPTDACWALLEKAPPTRPGRGGIVHRHFAHWIAAVGKHRGYDVAREWGVPGTTHPVDVMWRRAAHVTVFEVVVECRENPPSHVTACLVDSSAVHAVIMVTAQQGELDTLRAKLAADPAVAPLLDRVRFETISAYLEVLEKEVWPQ